MYNSQIVAERIKKAVKENNTTMDTLNTKCNLSKNAISSSSKSSEGMKAKNLYMIAEFLGVSVDYLLGRTDEPHTKFENVHYSNIVNGINGDNSPMTVPLECTQLDETTRQLVNAFQQLDFTGKAKVMGIIAELINK